MSTSGEDSPLPSVNARLGQLRPSRELLEYYRNKVAEFDNEHENMVKKLEEYKSSHENQHFMECELTQREREIADLQKAISDLQVCILQEREQVLRMYAENDRLKIREVGDRKRIQQLLALAGPAAAEVSYFHKEPPSKIIVPQKQPKAQLPNDIDPPIKPKSPKPCKYVNGMNQTPPFTSYDSQTLALQVEALQAQIEEQAKLAKDQVNALLEERRIIQEEADLAKERDKDRYERYVQRVREAQALLYESTQDILQLKNQQRANEKQWLAEKDMLLREMHILRGKLDSAQRTSDQVPKPPQVTALSLAHACVTDYEAKQHLESEIQTLEQQLEQAAKLADVYREQCIQIEDELARMREESEVHRDIFKERSEKMSKRLELMTIKYAALEKRRTNEVEGFKTDVKNLRKRLKDVEKQLYKVSIGGTVSDVDVLQTIRTNAGRSRAIQNELKNLKAKLYGLEGDLRGIY